MVNLLSKLTIRPNPEKNSFNDDNNNNNNLIVIKTQNNILLPIEIMQKMFKYSQKMGGSKSLFSCLFVNKYWCNCVASLLWESPFKHETVEYSYSENFPPALRNFTHNKNLFEPVEIYLSCLNKEDEPFPLQGKTPFLNYPIYLKQLDYGGLENMIISYLTNKFPDKDNQEEVQLISKIIFKLILQKSKNLRILTINNKNMKYEILNLQNFSIKQPGLSNLTKVKIDTNSLKSICQNIKYLLKLISLNCNRIHYFDIILKPEEYFIDIIHYITDIIKAQNYLMEFSISFVRLYFDQIMLALLSQKSSLVSIRLYNIMFTENSNNLLKEFSNLKDLSLIRCDGVDNDTLKIKSIFSIN